MVRLTLLVACMLAITTTVLGAYSPRHSRFSRQRPKQVHAVHAGRSSYSSKSVGFPRRHVSVGQSKYGAHSGRIGGSHLTSFNGYGGIAALHGGSHFSNFGFQRFRGLGTSSAGKSLGSKFGVHGGPVLHQQKFGGGVFPTHGKQFGNSLGHGFGLSHLGSKIGSPYGVLGGGRAFHAGAAHQFPHGGSHFPLGSSFGKSFGPTFAVGKQVSPHFGNVAAPRIVKKVTTTVVGQPLSPYGGHVVPIGKHVSTVKHVSPLGHAFGGGVFGKHLSSPSFASGSIAFGNQIPFGHGSGFAGKQVNIHRQRFQSQQFGK